jgi:hypothetical protein
MTGQNEATGEAPHIITAMWRKTKMGGITYPVALRLSGFLRIVRPIREEYSKTGSHGTWYYLAEEVDVLIYLEESNSGKRNIYTKLCRLEPQQCRAVEAAAWSAWIVAGATTREVEKRLEGLELAHG